VSLLVTGFEPFGGDAATPPATPRCGSTARSSPASRCTGARLPCVFARRRRCCAIWVDRLRPALVLCLGLAPSRRGFHPERVAINLIDARIADNAGAQPVDLPVHPAGPPAAFSTLPVKAMAAALRAAGIEAQVSYSARAPSSATRSSMH
jgi:pyroglutamyl-peptidase